MQFIREIRKLAQNSSISRKLNHCKYQQLDELFPKSNSKIKNHLSNFKFPQFYLWQNILILTHYSDYTHCFYIQNSIILNPR